MIDPRGDSATLTYGVSRAIIVGERRQTGGAKELRDDGAACLRIREEDRVQSDDVNVRPSFRSQVAVAGEVLVLKVTCKVSRRACVMMRPELKLEPIEGSRNCLLDPAVIGNSHKSAPCRVLASR